MSNLNEIISLAQLQVEVEQLRGEVAELTKSTRALVEAWNAAGSMVRFVKWASTFVAAIGSLWLFIKYGFKAGGG